MPKGGEEAHSADSLRTPLLPVAGLGPKSRQPRPAWFTGRQSASGEELYLWDVAVCSETVGWFWRALTFHAALAVSLSLSLAYHHLLCTLTFSVPSPSLAYPRLVLAYPDLSLWPVLTSPSGVPPPGCFCRARIFHAALAVSVSTSLTLTLSTPSAGSGLPSLSTPP